MATSEPPLKSLLRHGALTTIAEKLGITQPAVSQAIRRGNPAHPAVQEALRMIEESGALNTAQKLNDLPSVA